MRICVFQQQSKHTGSRIQHCSLVLLVSAIAELTLHEVEEIRKTLQQRVWVGAQMKPFIISHESMGNMGDQEAYAMPSLALPSTALPRLVFIALYCLVMHLWKPNLEDEFRLATSCGPPLASNTKHPVEGPKAYPFYFSSV